MSGFGGHFPIKLVVEIHAPSGNGVLQTKYVAFRSMSGFYQVIWRLGLEIANQYGDGYGAITATLRDDNGVLDEGEMPGCLKGFGTILDGYFHPRRTP